MLSMTRLRHVLGRRQTTVVALTASSPPLSHHFKSVAPPPLRGLHDTSTLQTQQMRSTSPPRDAPQRPQPSFIERVQSVISFTRRAAKRGRNPPTRILIFTILFVSTGVYILPEVTPETGRWHLLCKIFTFERERALFVFEHFTNGEYGRPLSKDHPIARRVLYKCQELLEANDLGTIIALDGNSSEEFAHSQEKQWRLLVLHGGMGSTGCISDDATIIFHTDTLPFVQDDERLAAVLTHEIAHGCLKHGAEWRALCALASWSVCTFLIGGPLYSLPLMSIFLWALPLPQRIEYEADCIGARLLARAGINPSGMIKFLQTHHDFEHITRFDGAVDWHPGSVNQPLFPSHPTFLDRVGALERQTSDLRLIQPQQTLSKSSSRFDIPPSSLLSVFAGRMDLCDVSQEEWEVYVLLYGFKGRLMVALIELINQGSRDPSNILMALNYLTKAFETASPAEAYDPTYLAVMLLGFDALKDYEHEQIRIAFQNALWMHASKC